jgi:hypothetical protein
MEGGSADTAGANICPSIHGHKKARLVRAFVISTEKNAPGKESMQVNFLL